MAVLGKGNVSDNGFPLPNFEPMPSNWVFPGDRAGNKQPFPAGGDGWYIVLPTTETGSVELYNDSGVLQWSKTPTQVNGIMSASSRWVAFYYDHSDALLYTVISRANISPSPMYLQSLNAAGTTGNIGSDQGTSSFQSSIDFTSSGGWGGGSFEGATLFRKGGDGSGDFTLQAGVNDTISLAEYVTINSSTGDWTESTPASLYLSTHDTYKAGYFNSNDIGLYNTGNNTWGSATYYIIDRSTGVVRDITSGTFLGPWAASTLVFGEAITPWGGYMVFLHDNTSTRPNGAMWTISQANFDIWLNRMAVFLGMRTGI